MYEGLCGFHSLLRCCPCVRCLFVGDLHLHRVTRVLPLAALRRPCRLCVPLEGDGLFYPRQVTPTHSRAHERGRERERRESGEPLLLARIGPRRRGELGSWGDSRPEHLFHPSIRFPCRLLFLLRATPLSQGEKPVRQPAGWCGWCGFGIHEARRTFCGSASLSLSHFPEFVYNLQYSVCSCGCVNAPQSIQNPVEVCRLVGLSETQRRCARPRADFTA